MSSLDIKARRSKQLRHIKEVLIWSVICIKFYLVYPMARLANLGQKKDNGILWEMHRLKLPCPAAWAASPVLTGRSSTAWWMPWNCVCAGPATRPG